MTNHSPFRVHPVTPSIRRVTWCVLIPCLMSAVGCDRIKRQLGREDNANVVVDPVWRSDSTYLANDPPILFRLIPHPKGTVAVPVASIGGSGFRTLHLSGRAWKALDVQFLFAGHALQTVKDGRVVGTVQTKRGMWDGVQLDTLEGCGMMIPAALVEGSPTARLAVVNATPRLKAGGSLTNGELQDALAKVPTLIAPSNGVPSTLIGRYSREIHELPTGAGTGASILAIYNDPERVSDTVPTSNRERPRQFIVILDKGLYGYRQSFTYKTLGNRQSAPKLAFLDMIDVDGDGKGELVFDFTKDFGSVILHGTVILAFRNDVWREIGKSYLRCQI